MMGLNFCIRWLIAAGVSQEEALQKAAAASKRAKRYPSPIVWIYPLAVMAVEWFLPLLLLGRLSRASSLQVEDFERLEQKLHRSYFFLRLLYTLVRLPLWEQLHAEEQPRLTSQHPLTNKISVPTNQAEFDVIVVGSGAGGAPLSWALSRHGLKVAIIESGGITQPHTTAFTIEHYFFKQGFSVSLTGGFTPILAGNTLGGTTAINSGTCLRPPKERLREWDEKAGSNFAPGELDPYFDIVEKVLGVTTPPRMLLNPADTIFEKGLLQLGRPHAYVLPRNASQCQGSGRCCFGCPTQAKQSTDLAFLPEATRHGCTLFANTLATRIKETPKGVLIEVNRPEGNCLLRARKLVLAAGALNTPRLIRRNRLGKYWHQAGDHLQIHPAGKVFAYFAEPVHSERGIPQGLGYNPPELPRLAFEGISTPKSTVSPMISAAGQRHCWWLAHYDHLACFGFLLRERAEGRVRYIGGWPVLQYQMTLEDVEDFWQGLLLCARVFFAAGAKRVLLPVVGIPNEFESESQLCQLRKNSQSQLLAGGFHPRGTAGIGRLVDQSLSLLGTDHIHVCDASVLPSSPGVNPQITIMGLSLYLADKLKKGKLL
jgi:hypothetical protein